MQYTFGGLVLASIFGMFFGSDGEMDPTLFSYIFWGLIGSGALLHFLVIVKDAICEKVTIRIESRSDVNQRYFQC